MFLSSPIIRPIIVAHNTGFKHTSTRQYARIIPRKIIIAILPVETISPIVFGKNQIPNNSFINTCFDYIRSAGYTSLHSCRNTYQIGVAAAFTRFLKRITDNEAVYTLVCAYGAFYSIRIGTCNDVFFAASEVGRCKIYAIYLDDFACAFVGIALIEYRNRCGFCDLGLTGGGEVDAVGGVSILKCGHAVEVLAEVANGLGGISEVFKAYVTETVKGIL